MQTDETLQPVAPQQPVDSQPTPPNLLLGRTLDKSVESQRRRLLAVSIPRTLTRDEVNRADEALDRLSLTFFASPNDSLANAFGAALKAAKRPPKAAMLTESAIGFDGGLVAAALDGQRLVISASDPGLVIVQQGEQSFSFPQKKHAGDEFLDPASTIFETKLDPGDVVALLSGGQTEERDPKQRLTQAEVAQIAGPKGAWVWIELEQPKKQDVRHRAGFLSLPEPEAQRTWSATAKPADPLWVKGVAADGAIFQKPPAIDTLNKYSGTSGDSFSRSARRRLPRGRPSLLLIASTLLVLLLVGSAFAFLYSNRPEGVQLPDPEIPQRTAELATALSSGDPAVIEAALPFAQRALAIGQRSKLPPEELALLENEILQAQDSLDGTLRLSNVQLFGRLPEGMSSDGLRLGESGGVLYLLDPQAFLIDPTKLTLLEMPFSPNAQVRSFSAQTSAENAAGVVLSDGSRLVLMNSDGDATELGVTTWPQGIDPTSGLLTGFQDRLYLFDQESGEILVADGQENVAYPWLADSEPSLPADALGMEINGAIHVIYADGRVVSLSSGEVYNRLDLGANSGDYEILAVDSGDETGDLYLATLENGTASLDYLDLADGKVSQILLPPTSIDDKTVDAIFDNVTSMVVSEARGQIYWIADDAVWMATLPEMPSAE